MGIVSTTLSQSNNMKFLLVLAVAAYARAEAEAKPGFVYTTGLHHAPLVYGGYAGYPYAVHHPVVYTAPVGCQNNEGVAVPCAHGVLPYGLVPAVAAPAAAEEPAEDAVVSVEKREAEPTAEADAEADPEADPWLYYHGLGYAARPYGYGYYGLGHHYGYAGYGYGHHLGYAGHYGHHLGYYGKRSAEAEPTAEADAEASPEADPWLYYHGLGYAAHPYGYGYYGLGYSAYAGYHPYAYYGGCRNGYGALVPCAGK